MLKFGWFGICPMNHALVLSPSAIISVAATAGYHLPGRHFIIFRFRLKDKVCLSGQKKLKQAPNR